MLQQPVHTSARGARGPQRFARPASSHVLRPIRCSVNRQDQGLWLPPSVAARDSVQTRATQNQQYNQATIKVGSPCVCSICAGPSAATCGSASQSTARSVICPVAQLACAVLGMHDCGSSDASVEAECIMRRRCASVVHLSIGGAPVKPFPAGMHLRTLNPHPQPRCLALAAAGPMRSTA
jgi:hypothetical protein